MKDLFGREVFLGDEIVTVLDKGNTYVRGTVIEVREATVRIRVDYMTRKNFYFKPGHVKTGSSSGVS